MQTVRKLYAYSMQAGRQAGSKAGQARQQDGTRQRRQAGKAGMSTMQAGRQGTVEKSQKVCSAQRKG